VSQTLQRADEMKYPAPFVSEGKDREKDKGVYRVSFGLWVFELQRSFIFD